MRTWLAAGVILMGLVTAGAGAVAMYTHGVIADETRMSGWNPALWLVLFAGATVTLLGTVQVAQSLSERQS